MMGIDTAQIKSDWQKRTIEAFSHWIALDARLLQFAQLNGGADIRAIADEMEALRCLLANLCQIRFSVNHVGDSSSCGVDSSPVS